MGLLLFPCFSRVLTGAQDLAPRGCIITLIHSNAITLSYALFTGDIIVDGDVPIAGANSRACVALLSYTHSFHMFGRSESVSASLPYGVGNFHGTIVGADTNAYRSGGLDASVRLSINLKGGPAMDVAARKWLQKTLLGVSLKVVVPTGQCEPTKLINYEANRWAFKPEVNLSRRWGHRVVDGYGALCLFTTNDYVF